MAVETQDVRELVDFAPEQYLVTSFYLDINADEFPAPQHIEKSFDSLIHTAEDKRKSIEPHLEHETQESVRGDLEKIRGFIKTYKRQDANGLAVFSCSAEDFWEVFETPTRLRSQVYFEHRPYVAPLAAFLSHTKPTAVLVTDKQQARIFTIEHGRSHEWNDIQDWVPHRTEKGGWSQNRYQRHSDHWAKHHIDRADELVLKLEQRHPFDWLIIGTEPDKRHEVVDELHPYVRDRLVGFIDVRVDAPESEVLSAARQEREKAEEHLVGDLMTKIQEYAGAGGRATIGLKDTVRALNEQTVHVLLVQQGYTYPGAFCPNCGMLVADQSVQTCPACDEPTQHADNIVDSAIQRAFELGSRVEVATRQNELQPIGCIGAILYY